MFMMSQRQMYKARRIDRVIRGIPSSENAGARLHRVIGTELLDQIGPFLLFEDMRAGQAGQDIIEHPHAGFEIVTLIMKGVAHHSTAGRPGRIDAGGLHGITSGRGANHGLVLNGEDARGFQLWLNLPSAHKRQDSVAREIDAADIPAVIFPGAEVGVLAGRFHGLLGPLASPPTQPLLLDVSLKHEGEISLPLPEGHQGFVYVFDGGVAVEQTLIDAGRAGLLAQDAGNVLNLVAGRDGARALVATALPIEEPVVRYGPFVMTDHDGIRQAFHDYQNGLF